MASLSSVTDYLEVLVAEQAKEKSADSVLAVSALVRQAKENLSEENFTDLRERAGYGEKVWSKFLQIGLDERLIPLAKREQLPSSYTTIHAIHCLSDEELEAAKTQGIIYSNISQGNLTRWLRGFRYGELAGEDVDETPLITIHGPSDLSEETFGRLREDLQKIASIYGCKTITDADASSVSLRQQQSLDKSKQLEITLMKDLKSTWDKSEHQYRTLFGVNSLDDLVNAKMPVFTGFLNKVRGSKDAFWRLHSHDFIHKNAMEFCKCNGRGQRYNYKRRLREVAEKFPHLAEKVKETYDTWMQY